MQVGEIISEIQKIKLGGHQSMRKISAFLLSTMMLFVLAVPAMAANDDTTDTRGNGMTTNNATRGNTFDADLGTDRGTGTRGTTGIGTNNNGIGDNDIDTTRGFGVGDYDDDNNFRATAAGDDTRDWGWLGLLGLIGLAGLFNRNRETTR
jgi:hypothetical protein